MSATVASYAPVVRRQFSGGEEWTEEQKAEYQKQWDNFKLLMIKRQQGQTRDFVARVLEVGEAHTVANTFPGAKNATRVVRTIRLQLDQKGVDMLRFMADSADNPFNEKTLLHKLIIATMGFTPQQEAGLDIDFADLVGKRVRVTIMKQRERTDGKRGGFYSRVSDITPIFDDEDELPAPKAATRAQVSSTPMPWESGD